MFSERATISCNSIYSLAEHWKQWDVTEENVMHVVYISSAVSR